MPLYQSKSSNCLDRGYISSNSISEYMRELICNFIAPSCSDDNILDCPSGFIFIFIHVHNISVGSYHLILLMLA